MPIPHSIALPVDHNQFLRTEQIFKHFLPKVESHTINKLRIETHLHLSQIITSYLHPTIFHFCFYTFPTIPNNSIQFFRYFDHSIQFLYDPLSRRRRRHFPPPPPGKRRKAGEGGVARFGRKTGNNLRWQLMRASKPCVSRL